MICKELFDILEGRKVCLIGGSPSYVPPCEKEDHYFYVWVNNHWLDNTHMPCGAVYASGAEPPLGEYPDTVKYISAAIDTNYSAAWWHYADRKGFKIFPHTYKRYFAPNPYGPEHEWVNRLYGEIETKPFSGILAAQHLLFYPIEELYITGMTFYYCPERGKHPYKRGPHLIEPQRNWLARTAQADQRIRFDPFLTECCTYKTLFPGVRVTEWDADTETAWTVERLPTKAEAKETGKEVH
jgi:hypothetical protein